MGAYTDKKAELGCVYSALILYDDDIPITAEKIQTILKAASVDVEPYWPGLFSKALESISLKDLITNISAGVASTPVTATTAGKEEAAATPAPAKEVKETKEESEESDDDMGFGLFE